MENNYIVYMHTLFDGRKYVGITRQSPEKRWRNGRGYTHSLYFFNAIQKYGWNSFKHEILFDGLTLEQACNKEKALIKLFHSNAHDFGFNITAGGECAKHTEETKEKLRQTSTKWPIDKNKSFDLYIIQNKSQKECAEILGVPLHIINRRLSQWNFTKTQEQRNKSISAYKIDDKLLEDLYLRRGLTRKECAKILGVPEYTIKQHVEACNFRKIKSRHNSIVLSYNEVYYYYIELNWTLDQCLEHFECGREQFIRLLQKYKIKKDLTIKILKEDLITQYVVLKKPIAEIANYFGCSVYTIYKKINEYNIKKRKRPRRCSILKEDLYYQHIVLKKTREECAKYFNCSLATIRNRLKEYSFDELEFGL